MTDASSRARQPSVTSSLPRRLPQGLAQAIMEAADRAGIGIAVMTADQGPEPHPVYVGRGLAELLGMPREEVLALSKLPGHRPLECELPPAAAALETEIERADGTKIPARVAVARAVGVSAETWVTIYFPLAARSLAERALVLSEQRFLRLIEAAPDAIIIAKPTGEGQFQVVYANPAALRGSGYSSLEEYLALSPAEHVHEEDGERFLTGMQLLLARTETTHQQEFRIRRRDGGYVRLDAVSILADWDGTPSVLTMARDLSERSRLQAQLVQTDRVTAAGTLAAGVAHEINNPLAYVLLNLQYLLRELPRMGDDPQRLEQLLGRLREAHHGAQRVSSIVRDLREFSGPEPEQLGPVDLRRVIGAALKVVNRQFEGRARVVEEYQAVPPVQGNAARLEQVFMNLLVNAAQALAPERADTNQVRVTLRAKSAGNVLAEIADNGAGISDELLGRVFDPFFTTKPAGVGTGLGLPICHSIIHSLGGEITVESELGRGTIFRITLPTCARVMPPRSATPFPFAAPATPRVRVLVVDDELPVASMLSKLLAEEHEVRVTTSGREALELLLGPERFDVVLCDLLMPGMSGMDLHRQLAEQRPGLEASIVFMTGGAFTPRAGEFLARVGNPRIEKPFNLNQVRRLVRKLGMRLTPRGD